MSRKLIELLPVYLQNIRELKAICAAVQPYINIIDGQVRIIVDNQLIDHANEYGIGRYEKIIGIKPKGTATLDERRFSVKLRLTEFTPYTLESLRERLALITGSGGSTVASSGYTLTVRVALAAGSKYADVEQLLSRVAPANIVVDLSLLFTRYGEITHKTYGQLSAWTYDQIRNGGVA